MGQFRWTTKALLAKIESEGGIFEAIAWGIRSEDIIDNPRLSAEWRIAEEYVDELEDVFNAIEDILHEEE